MAIIFRTPDILANITKQSHYDEQDNYSEKTIEVQKTEVKLLKTLRRMAKSNGEIPISQTQLAKSTDATNGTIKHYDYIFKDVIDMFSLFFHAAPTRVTKNPKFQEAKALMDKYDIHDFDTLLAKANHFMIWDSMPVQDSFADKVLDLAEKGVVSKEFSDKTIEFLISFMAHVGERGIHKDFTELDINGMDKKVHEKYQKVQELKAEYDRLKAETSN